MSADTKTTLRAKIARMNAAHDAYLEAVRDLDREMQTYTGTVTIDKPDVALIIDVVSEYYGTRPTVILSRVRTNEIALARFVAMVLVRKFKKFTLTETGRIFNRDHGTVLNAERAIESWRDSSAKLREEFAAIENNVKRRLEAQRAA